MGCLLQRAVVTVRAVEVLVPRFHSRTEAESCRSCRQARCKIAPLLFVAVCALGHSQRTLHVQRSGVAGCCRGEFFAFREQSGGVNLAHGMLPLENVNACRHAFTRNAICIQGLCQRARQAGQPRQVPHGLYLRLGKMACGRGQQHSVAITHHSIQQFLAEQSCHLGCGVLHRVGGLQQTGRLHAQPGCQTGLQQLLAKLGLHGGVRHQRQAAAACVAQLACSVFEVFALVLLVQADQPQKGRGLARLGLGGRYQRLLGLLCVPRLELRHRHVQQRLVVGLVRVQNFLQQRNGSFVVFLLVGGLGPLQGGLVRVGRHCCVQYRKALTKVPVGTMPKLTREIVLVVAVGFVLRTVRRFYNTGALIFSGLVYYRHPSASQLRQFSSEYASASKKKKKAAQQQSTDQQVQLRQRREDTQDFTISKDAPVTLEPGVVDNGTFKNLHFCEELDDVVSLFFASLLAFAICAGLAALTQTPLALHTAYAWWIFVAVGWTAKVLVSLTLLYRNEELAILLFLFTSSFMLSLSAVLGSEVYLDVSLRDAYEDLAARIALYSNSLSVDIRLPAFRTLQALGAAALGVVATTLAFPAFRFARCHAGVMKSYSDRPALMVLFQINFFFPLLCSLLFIPALGRDVFVTADDPEERSFQQRRFENVRLLLMCVACLLRLGLVRPYMQAFFNTASDRLDNLAKATEKKLYASAVQRYTGNIFLFSCAAGLQLLAPFAMTFLVLLLQKAKGGYGWYSWQDDLPKLPPLLEGAALDNALPVFGPVFFRELCGFVAWWMCTTSAMMSLVGMAFRRFGLPLPGSS
eukprot:m.250863 g.250863  ORF g.250863 m.250863 type:complete len:806 (+) comp22648_c1_seq7:2083-4500(+)